MPGAISARTAHDTTKCLVFAGLHRGGPQRQADIAASRNRRCLRGARVGLTGVRLRLLFARVPGGFAVPVIGICAELVNRTIQHLAYLRRERHAHLRYVDVEYRVEISVELKCRPG